MTRFRTIFTHHVSRHGIKILNNWHCITVLPIRPGQRGVIQFGGRAINNLREVGTNVNRTRAEDTYPLAFRCANK